MAIVRKYFPNAQFGADEVVDASRPWVQELVEWVDTFKAVTGEPLAYIHTDLNWTEGAVRNVVPLAAALKQRHVALGVIYDADSANNNNDENWSRNTISHFAEIESGLRVHPDHAVIETWTDDQITHRRASVPRLYPEIFGVQPAGNSQISY